MCTVIPIMQETKDKGLSNVCKSCDIFLSYIGRSNCIGFELASTNPKISSFSYLFVVSNVNYDARRTEASKKEPKIVKMILWQPKISKYIFHQLDHFPQSLIHGGRCA